MARRKPSWSAWPSCARHPSPPTGTASGASTKSKTGRPRPPASPRLRGAPLGSAEARVAEEVVGQAHRLHGLVAVAQVGEARVARADHVRKTDRVRAEQAEGE